MTYLLGFLLLSLVPVAAVPVAAVPDTATFDRQLERFTRLAIEGNVQEAVTYLRQPGFLRAADHEGHTALFAATVACNTDLLDAVLARAPQVNHRDHQGATALFYAASQGAATCSSG
jgi:hypothetical protein